MSEYLYRTFMLSACDILATQMETLHTDRE